MLGNTVPACKELTVQLETEQMNINSNSVWYIIRSTTVRMSRVLWELREVVSNSESLKKLLEGTSLLYLYSAAQCVEQMVLES